MAAEQTRPTAPLSRAAARAGRLLRRSLRLAFVLARALVVVFFTILLVRAFDARGRGDLEIWHTTELEGEFTAQDGRAGVTLGEYLEREERLFAELHEKVTAHVVARPDRLLSRYAPGSRSNPSGYARDWNRTFEMAPAAPGDIRGGVLLLHGLTDSPYSLRRLGEVLADQGFYVLGLRLPGHGTIPNALSSIRWEDWLAATEVGARHVHATVGGRGPFVVVGYSNGGGLALEYTLRALRDGGLPAPDRLILFSPAVGVTPFAALARWASVFAVIPYFEKSKWTSIAPEYDPFKYNSSPLNAGHQVWRLSRRVQRDLARAADEGSIARLPPILTFQSLIDSTVLTSAVLEHLYDRLQSPGSELVLFDINRVEPLKYLLASDPAPIAARLEDSSRLPYRLTLVTNHSDDSRQMVAISKDRDSAEVVRTPLDTTWPPYAFSLSHVALPFAPDDELYGLVPPDSTGRTGMHLGMIELRGEKHLLRISADDYMRLRHNPFFAYVEERVREAVAGPGSR